MNSIENKRNVTDFPSLLKTLRQNYLQGLDLEKLVTGWGRLLARLVGLKAMVKNGFKMILKSIHSD